MTELNKIHCAQSAPVYDCAEVDEVWCELEYAGRLFKATGNSLKQEQRISYVGELPPRTQARCRLQSSRYRRLPSPTFH